ncbi:hypothetical protein [Microtetraspora glauca]|uniref:Uncharacterized protein n=1 Tax=Microtetraspora glauca TaxID=1996 RepID=A0ABV3GHP8_MICGL
MTIAYLLIDIDGVLIPFPRQRGNGPATHVRHLVIPTGYDAAKPVPIWLNPAHGPMLTNLFQEVPVTPVWCTSWHGDASTLIGPKLGLPPLPHVELGRPAITTSHPNGYLWKRDPVTRWLRSSRLDRRRLHSHRPRLGRSPYPVRHPNAPHPARPHDRSGTVPP